MPFHENRNKRPGGGRRTRRATRPAVEALEGRALLSMASNMPMYPLPTPTGPSMPTPAPMTPSPSPITSVPPAPEPMVPIMPMPVSAPHTTRAHHARTPMHGPTGVVTKAPHFYEFYTGPKLAELNAVKASAELQRNGNFVFTGTNQGKINQTPATYVWGVDRNGQLPPGPFMNRPDIRFDAVVVVKLSAGNSVNALVLDTTTGAATPIDPSMVKIHGRTISVTVPGTLLPSTGLPPSQFRFNYWPEDGGPPISSSVASFAPEFTTAQVGSAR